MSLPSTISTAIAAVKAKASALVARARFYAPEAFAFVIGLCFGYLLK